MLDAVDKPLVLLIDDKPKSVQTIIRKLESHNIQVHVVEGSAKALEALRIKVPDLILLDMVMPGLNGFETCLRKKNTRSGKYPRNIYE